MLGTDLMNTAEVLEELKVHRTTLERWVATGEFPSPSKLGGRLYWRRDVVQRWVEERFPATDARDDAAAERA